MFLGSFLDFSGILLNFFLGYLNSHFQSYRINFYSSAIYCDFFVYISVTVCQPGSVACLSLL